MVSGGLSCSYLGIATDVFTGSKCGYLHVAGRNCQNRSIIGKGETGYGGWVAMELAQPFFVVPKKQIVLEKHQLLYPTHPRC